MLSTLVISQYQNYAASILLNYTSLWLDTHCIFFRDRAEGIYNSGDGEVGVFPSLLKFVLKENCRKSILGVTKVSWRHVTVTWLVVTPLPCSGLGKLELASQSVEQLVFQYSPLSQVQDLTGRRRKILNNHFMVIRGKVRLLTSWRCWHWLAARQGRQPHWLTYLSGQALGLLG